jgi:uncharacterized repeat protein (TIGR01451 family)
MNKKTSFTMVLKNEDSVKVLKDVSVDFSIFSAETIELTKVVDRPNDYYVEGDEITFTINLKNVGDKRIVNFTLKDELEEFVLPIEDGYRVSSTHGQIASYVKPVVINNITLKPGEVAQVVIKGIINCIE